MEVNAFLTTFAISLVGLCCGVFLVFSLKKFYVPTDETVDKITSLLPGANCGACGFAGCSAFAKALIENHDLKCPVISEGNWAKITKILGIENKKTVKKIYFVKCRGFNDKTKTYKNNTSLSCAVALKLGIKSRDCEYGCIGYGDCVNVCKFDAIKIVNGVAVIDPTKCTGCGECAKVCPIGIIDFTFNSKFVVECNSNHNIKESLKVCKNACIGCGKCKKVCEHDAIEIKNSLAVIDPTKCTGCGECAKVCPTKAIKEIKGA